MHAASAFLHRHRAKADLALRLAFGVHLLVASTGLFSSADQRKFAAYLASIHIPFPLLGAYLSHITEFFGGLALILGLGTRAISAALLFNFGVAVTFALHGQPYAKQFQAWQMLAVSAFFLFNGAGAWSLDAWRESQT